MELMNFVVLNVKAEAPYVISHRLPPHPQTLQWVLGNVNFDFEFYEQDFLFACWLVACFWFLGFVWEKDLLCNPGYAGTHYVNQASI